MHMSQIEVYAARNQAPNHMDLLDPYNSLCFSQMHIFLHLIIKTLSFVYI